MACLEAVPWSEGEEACLEELRCGWKARHREAQNVQLASREAWLGKEGGDRGCRANGVRCCTHRSLSFQATGPQSPRHHLWLAWPDRGDTVRALRGGHSGFLPSQSALSSFPT